jgi:ribonuclease HI
VARQPITVYTDGACSGNPGPGGWAWAVSDGPYRSGAEAMTTNQRMELQAVLDAVLSFDGDLDIVSDSTYVVNCFRDRWWEGWIARGWKNAQRKDVANQDLWKPLISAYQSAPGRLQFRWVRGHGSDPMNDLVDRLAVQAALSGTGRCGHGQPDGLGPPDGASRSVGSGRSARAGGKEDPEVPTGYLVVVTGLRPPSLGGWGDTSISSSLRDQLTRILAAMAELHDDLMVLTGLDLGTEQLAAEAAAAAGVAYCAVLAFPDPDRRWPAASRERFATLLAGAARVVVLEQVRPDTARRAAAALARHDAWLARHANESVVVWDHRDPAVGRSLRSLKDHVGEEQVWVVEP